ncbi:hypothetical protein C7476_1321 [Phyllobacterium bourgognense]|uniref:Uncharacterized protein n=2 Tax=Phyllobacterium bourgognense TaxID=314236 RepID=A0A368YF47_9HYPH|nr:hypothetical protein C7476_1321 [Phyllobacterium bourgognense]
MRRNNGFRTIQTNESGTSDMRNRDIEPLELRDFLIMAVLLAAVLFVLWGTVLTIGNTRHTFEVQPVVAR